MIITTTKLGTRDIDLTPHKRKKGLNNIVESIIVEMKSLSNVTTITNQERETLHKEIRDTLLS